MSGQLIIKAAYGDNLEIRRIPIFNRDLTHSELCIMLSRLFKHRIPDLMHKVKQSAAMQVPDLKLQYRDDEGDWIALTDDVDISHALSLNGSVLHLKVELMLTGAGHQLDAMKSQSLVQLKQELLSVKTRFDQLLAKIDKFMADYEPLPSTDGEDDDGGDVEEESHQEAVKPLSTADMAEFLDATAPPRVDSTQSRKSVASAVQPSSLITSTTAALGDLAPASAGPASPRSVHGSVAPIPQTSTANTGQYVVPKYAQQPQQQHQFQQQQHQQFYHHNTTGQSYEQNPGQHSQHHHLQNQQAYQQQHNYNQQAYGPAPVAQSPVGSQLSQYQQQQQQPIYDPNSQRFSRGSGPGNEVQQQQIYAAHGTSGPQYQSPLAVPPSLGGSNLSNNKRT